MGLGWCVHKYRPATKNIDYDALLWSYKLMLYIYAEVKRLESTHLAIHWESTLSQKSSEVSCPGYNCRWCLLWRWCQGAHWMPNIVWHNQSIRLNGNLMIDPLMYFVLSPWYIWGLWRQKQVSQARMSNSIPQNNVGCNYFSLPEIPAFGSKVLIYAITELLYLWNCRLNLFCKQRWAKPASILWHK